MGILHPLKKSLLLWFRVPMNTNDFSISIMHSLVPKIQTRSEGELTLN